MKTFLKLCLKILSAKKAQEFLIETAKYLAKKTENKTDDEVVAWFESIWKAQK